MNKQPKPNVISWSLKRKKRIFFLSFVLLILFFSSSLYVYPRLICGGSSLQSGCFIFPEETNLPLKVMSLNIAHGRGTGPNQLFLKKKTFINNLDSIAEILKKENCALVALQEADGPSIWSGKFNHVKYLAEKAEYPYYTRGEHVKGLGVTYGTAILSKLPLSNQTSIAFKPGSITPPKGFIKCTVQLPGSEGKKVEVVSVHLDFARSSVRKKQVKQLVDTLSKSENHLIVMGDFNCEWNDKKGALKKLLDGLKLKAYLPASKDLKTFNTLDKRLDWILVSQNLKFDKYKVLSDNVSDHQAVVSVIE